MSIDFWEQNANNWAQAIQQQAIASRAVTSQALIDSIESYKIKSVLDIGCGEGWLGRELQKKQISYYGIDGSANLISLAAKKQPNMFAQVSYEQLQEHRWKPPQLFQGLVFNFSLLDKEVILLLKSCARFLEPQGKIFIQTLNPKNFPKDQDSWYNEDFKSMTVPFNGTMPWFGRSLQSWLAVFQECGLLVEKAKEPIFEKKPASIIFVLTKI